MNTLEITVKGTNLRVVQAKTSVQNCVAYDRVSFSTDRDWEGTQKTAVFWRGDMVRQVFLGEDTQCDIPWELLVTPGQISIGLIGTKGQQVIATKPAVHAVTAGTLREGTAPEEPTPSLYAQLTTQMAQTRELAQSVTTRADRGEFNGKAATVQVGTVTTGEAGSNAVVENRGTTDRAILDFAIPRGETGPKGADGLTTAVKINGNTHTQNDGTVDLGDGYVKGVYPSNPNLLENWYFVGGGTNGKFPINQRGKTAYNGTVGNTIDRWKGYSASATCNLTLNEGGMEIGSLDNGSIYLINFLGPKAPKATDILTISCLTTEGLYTLTAQASRLSCYMTKGITIAYDANVKFVYFFRGESADTTSITLLAVKMEYGTEQTLAHQENGVWVLNEIPDYTTELLKCQRYFQTFSTEAVRPANRLDFRPVMNANPTLGTITVGEDTLYTASAEL